MDNIVLVFFQFFNDSSLAFSNFNFWNSTFSAFNLKFHFADDSLQKREG